MAVLSDSDYRELRESIYRKGLGKEELNALSGGLPKSQQIRAAFQALEDCMTTDLIPQAAVGVTIGNYAKARFESGLGRTITMALFIKIFQAWIKWKVL